MRLSTLTAITALLGLSAAFPANGHHRHHQKRQDVIVTVEVEETEYVTEVVYNTQGQQGSPVQTEVVSAAAETSQSVAAPAASSSSSSSSSDSSSGDSGFSSAESVSQGGAKGITYSPYNSDGSCKSLEQVKADFADISGYPVVRLYGVDCNQVANVLQAKGADQKLFLGLYYMDQIDAGVQTMADAISQYGSWDDVYTVSVGNELVNSGEATPAQVGQYVATARSALTAAGYTGPIVAVDTFIAVIEHPELCQYSDYMGVNAHAYYNKITPAPESGEWVLQQIQRVWTACGGSKNVFITETGWPSRGDTYGVAVPSKPNQIAAVDSIKQVCGNDVILFSAYNQLWKNPGPWNVEQYWGIYSP